MALSKRDLAHIDERIEAKLREALGKPGAAAHNGQVWNAVHELTGSVARLEKAVEELAAAQKRTEQRVEELAAAQKRTEQRVEELAAAIERTNETMRQGFADLRRAVGGLADAVGFSLEEIGRELLPHYLARKFGVQVALLEARWFDVPGRRVEINYVASGRRDGQEVVVLGESQSRIGPGAVADFADRFDAVEKHLGKPAFRLAFGYSVHPDAEAVAQARSITLVAGWQLKQP